ncbi:glycosyltransferase [uncultured Methanobrevibacter sp.]|uniref:glycosyltransferase n=1 Tax=uncultured Methanobrevibacter sp. TaxID=253161 RepID=UPI0025839C21|nr:glycosyltransferase [uncultured Methanobrevibacter sp.]
MNGSDVKISILMPCLNVAPYIRQCIESVINQSLKNIEIILIDAGSNDGTLEIIEEYASKDSRIQIIYSDKKSYGYQMNLGLDVAIGQYIGIVETDDFIEENMYEDLYNLSENGKIDIVKCNFYNYYDYEDVESKLIVDEGKEVLKNVKGSFSVFEQPYFLHAHPSIWCGIYKKEFLERNSIRFMEEKGGGWVDNPFFYRTALKAKNIVYIHKPYYYYRESNPNSSSNALSDFTIPIKRMIDNLNVLNEYNIHDENILYVSYLRVFAYLNNISRRDNYEEYWDELKLYIHKMMLLIDENVFLDKFGYSKQKIYYKYLSSICIVDYDVPEVVLSNEEYNTILKERNFLLKYNHCLNNKIKNVQDENKKLDKNLKLIKNSKAYKLGLKFAYPIRKCRSLIKSDKKFSSDTLNVLFIPSDNNKTSGAFLSMVNLISILKKKYALNILVILPNKGNGNQVLESFGIDYKLIESYDWVIPLSQKKDTEYEKEVQEKIKINNKAIDEISKIIRDYNINLLHINTTYSYVGAKAALNNKIPFVWHLREFLEEDQGNTTWDRDKSNELINKANRIIAISDSIYDKYSNIFDEGKLVRIYNGIDENKFYKPYHEILKSKIIRFIMVGGFEYYKGQIEFAKACVKLYQSGFHDFEVWFIGTGREDVKKEVEYIFSEAGLNNVKYLGYKNNVEYYYDKADISFTCSQSEAFGRTTVEGMLSGNLVIGANSAGTKELIHDGDTGILYEPGNDEDLCKKMLYVINNKTKVKKIAKKGQDFMFKNMTAEKNADNIYDLYDLILNNLNN